MNTVMMAFKAADANGVFVKELLAAEKESPTEVKTEQADAPKGMREVVINTSFGGFGLSDIAYDLCVKFIPNFKRYSADLALRSNPTFVKIVKTLGSLANDHCSKLGIILIPESIDLNSLYIDEYDGLESIHEKHRVWGANDAYKI